MKITNDGVYFTLAAVAVFLVLALAMFFVHREVEK